MTSRGISSKNERSNQIAIARFIAVYITTRVAMLSIALRSRAMMKIGMITPTAGRNFVDKKKNMTLELRLPRLQTRAYAHGRARMTITIDDAVTTMTELRKKGPKPRSKITW